MVHTVIYVECRVWKDGINAEHVQAGRSGWTRTSPCPGVRCEARVGVAHPVGECDVIYESDVMYGGSVTYRAG